MFKIRNAPQITTVNFVLFILNLGVEFSGDVLSVGSNVKTVAKGDRIVAMSTVGGGFGTECKVDHRVIPHYCDWYYTLKYGPIYGRDMGWVGSYF